MGFGDPPARSWRYSRTDFESLAVKRMCLPSGIQSARLTLNPGVEILRGIPAPVGNSVNSPTDPDWTVAATHWRSGENAIPIPSPSRIAGEPSVLRIKTE